MAEIKKIQVMAYFDNDSGRDVEMLMPLIFFVRTILNCEVKFAFVFDYHAMYRSKPDLILLPNIIGSHLYRNVAKYAWQQDVPVFALESEGNFRTDGVFNHWGFNYDKVLYQQYLCCWSDRAKNYLMEREPNIKDRIVVTGGVGFDKYQWQPFLKKKVFYDKVNFTPTKGCVLYSGWTFGKVKFERGKKDFLKWFNGDHSKMDLIEPQRADIEALLRSAIENNPDTLFILKKHPKEVFQTESEDGIVNEMSNLQHYKNVRYVGSEYEIQDLVAVADLLLAFESTTALEAWLLGKTSILMRTIEGFSDTYKKKNLHISQPVARDSESLNKYISEFLETGKIDEFESVEKKDQRDKIIKNSIGFSDGMNHVRAGYYFNQVLTQIQQGGFKYNWSFRFKHYSMYILIRIGLLIYNRKLFSLNRWTKKFIFLFDQYRLDKTKRTYDNYSLFLREFYNKKGIQDKFDNKELFQELRLKKNV